MLLLLQVACVLGVTVQSSTAAEIRKTVFYSDSFLDGNLEDLDVYQFNQNSGEVGITFRPGHSTETPNQSQNSNEVSGTAWPNSAEVSGTAWPNSAEVSGTPQPNTVEVAVAPATNNPFGFVEVTAKPTQTENPSTDSPQVKVEPSATSETVKPNVNKETNNDNNNVAGSTIVPEETVTESEQPSNANIVGTTAGTQPFFPSSSNVAQVPEETGTETEQPSNANIVGTAPGTQIFFPSSSNVAQVPEETVTEAEQPGNANIVGTATGTQPFFPLLIQDNTKQGTGSKPIRPASAVTAIRKPGVEPIPSLVGANPNADNPVNEGGLEPLLPEPISNSLRDALAQAGVVEDTIDDPVVEQAKQYFMSIWNLEAHRLEAPYLEVTDVWPEIGMVYMPTINKMSSNIQNSKPVKVAAERLKAVWEARTSNTENNTADGGHVLSLLTDFISSWGIGASEDARASPP